MVYTDSDYFGEGKVDSQRHNKLVEKLRHRRGQSLSKLEGAATPSPKNKNANTGNSSNSRKSNNLQSEGYFSSDEKTEHLKNVRATANNIRLKDSPLNDKMTQSCVLPCVSSPHIELKPFAFDLNASFTISDSSSMMKNDLFGINNVASENKNIDDLIGAIECEHDKSDSVSEAGTYTLDADNYSEEQKARMSIDREYKIEQLSGTKKTEDYVRSLLINPVSEVRKESEQEVKSKYLGANEPVAIVKPQTLDLNSGPQRVVRILDQKQKALSPILSPTQQFSITQSNPSKSDYSPTLNNEGNEVKKLFNQIMFPSAKEKTATTPDAVPMDQGSIISVTSSGAFRSRSDKNKKHVKNFSLSKSGVQIEAYTENKYQNEIVVHAALTLNKNTGANLTANVIHVSDNLSRVKNNDPIYSESRGVSSCEMLIRGNSNLSKESNLSPAGLCGKSSPTKIPSPIHSSRPRSRNSASFANTDLSDSSLETDSYLKPTQNIIKSLQQRLSIDSDHELNTKYLNNDARNLLKKPSHLRHNSFDDKNLKISNKLEHFQNKNLQSIDQTYTNVLNHYKTNKIQNSPNNSPIRRSSSFSTKNHNNSKNLNISSKDTNILHSPSLSNRNSNIQIQRSASTTNIKPSYMQIRRSSVTSDHQKIDRNAFGDTESSSEEDFEKNLKKKDITNTRYNRAFSLRRARLEPDTTVHPKCPNTPEMRRKFHTSESRPERAISVDRKPVKTNEVQSRYLQNISKKSTPTPSSTGKSDLPPKNVSNAAGKSSMLGKLQGFSRTDSGRFSMRSSAGPHKNLRKDHPEKKQSGGRSNSSLSSREVEFQNWKRRKSYDPMKAAAEGKRKAEMARRQNSLTPSTTDGNQDCDSSPSHSSSVHRSQSFHGTAALEQLISSDEEDLTLSVDEGFSPPTPSPCELSPARACLKYAWKD
ncbi:hypothetical protein Trydic_g142 [Trypoxylus dichotomus]